MRAEENAAELLTVLLLQRARGLDAVGAALQPHVHQHHVGALLLARAQRFLRRGGDRVTVVAERADDLSQIPGHDAFILDHEHRYFVRAVHEATASAGAWRANRIAVHAPRAVLV